MAQSLSKIYLHIIFSTKNRLKIIKPEIERELYTYIAGILKNLDCSAIQIGGTSDHIHILNTLSRSITISDMVGLIKKDTSKWIKKKGQKFNKFYWQNGYGVFSVGQSKLNTLKSYIANQKEHHMKISFQEEYRKFLKEHRIIYDEKYLWE